MGVSHHGRIGVYETVSQFVDIAIDAQFQNDDNLTWIETITFTTKYYGDVEPKITLEPVADDFRLTSASTKPDLSREDVHEVIISFVIKPEAGTKKGQEAATADAKTQAIRNINREQNLDVARDILDEIEER